MSKIYRLPAINLIFLHQNPKGYTESEKEYDLGAKSVKFSDKSVIFDLAEVEVFAKNPTDVEK